MNVGVIISIVLGVLAPACLIGCCASELLGARMAQNPRSSKEKLDKAYGTANALLVGAWLLLAAAYLVFNKLAGAPADQESLFRNVMAWALGIVLVADMVFLVLRKKRPEEYRGRKHFWEKK